VAAIAAVGRIIVIAVDPRLVFLQRAAARLLLVEAGEIDIDDAITDLADAFHWLVPCTCVREVLDRWERQYPPRKRRAVR
jgi:hypothetical protein